jgi:hypothetical protein
MIIWSHLRVVVLRIIRDDQHVRIIKGSLDVLLGRATSLHTTASVIIPTKMITKNNTKKNKKPPTLAQLFPPNRQMVSFQSNADHVKSEFMRMKSMSTLDGASLWWVFGHISSKSTHLEGCLTSSSLWLELGWFSWCAISWKKRKNPKR